MKKLSVLVLMILSGLLFAGEKVDNSNSDRDEVAKAIFLVCGTDSSDEEVIMIASVFKNRTKDKAIKNEPNMKASVKNFQAKVSITSVFKHKDLVNVADILAAGGKVEDNVIMKRWELCWKYSTDWFKPTTPALLFSSVDDPYKTKVVKVAQTKHFLFYTRAD